jgi:hypothetical protein
MKLKSPLIKVIAFGLSVVLCRCSMSPFAGGNSSQTGNNGLVISSYAQSISGTTIPDARVSIYDKHFRPYLTPSGFCDSTIADEGGRFTFVPGQDGYYNLLVYDVHSGGAAFVQHIPVFTGSVFTDTFDTLKQPGFITGIATDTAGTTYALSYVYIDGSPFYTVTRNNGEFQLGPLPAGTYTTGFFANFMVANIKTGSIVQMTSVRTDTTVVTVFPDSVSTWHW